MLVASVHRVSASTRSLARSLTARPSLADPKRRPRESAQPLVFGYRRPPPWKPIASQLNSLPDDPANFAHAKQDITSWPQLIDTSLHLREIPSGQDPTIIPELAHGMDVVLRGDGLYPLEAPWLLKIPERTTPLNRRWPSHRHRHSFYYKDYIRKIVQPEDIAWWNIPGYVPAADDLTLHRIAAETPGVRYSSSTSSISPAIATMYHLLSNYRDTDLLGGLSAQLADLPSHFSKYHRRPVAFTLSLNRSDRVVYTLNAHSGSDNGPSILRDLGHSMERMLTTSAEEFTRKYVASQSEVGRASEYPHAMPSSHEQQFYHYSQASQFLLRAQIDCRNAATGEVFDVKTRAVAKIRYDLANYLQYTSHKLRFLKGKTDSYEREFYDMVRTVFLKYALQLRIGRMAGALVAYHNTTELLGLEYISLKEIESYIFGSERWADVAFGTAVHLLQEVLGTITKSMPLDDCDEKLKVMLYTEWSKLKMFVFVQRLKKGEVDAFGNKEFERRDQEGEVTTPSEGLKTKLQACGQWHLDSELHKKGSGVAIVGAHGRIRALGGEWIAGTGTGGQRKRRVAANRDVFNHLKFDLSGMRSGGLKVWELKVAPLMNEEEVPRRNISLGDGDQFRLRYQLREVEKLSSEHECKFVSGLARVYLR